MGQYEGYCYEVNRLAGLGDGFMIVITSGEWERLGEHLHNYLRVNTA